MSRNLRIFLAFLLLFCPFGNATYRNCSMTFSKVGCFRQKQAGLLTTLITDRDSTSPHFGQWLNWKKFPESLYSLICRCSKVAKDKGFNHISIAFWGECYGGTAKIKIEQLVADKHQINECFGQDFKLCNDSNKQECAGAAYAEYIFKIGPRPVDGNYSDWSNFTPCSRSCGCGYHKRIRTCTKPSPFHGGRNCSGPSEEVKSCNLALCPGLEGITEVKDLVKDIFVHYFSSTQPSQKLSAKFYSVVSEIQRASGAVGTLSGLRHERVPLQRKIQNLKSTLYVTAKKRNVGFSRFTMGILLAVYIEKRINEGSPLCYGDSASNAFVDGIVNRIGQKAFQNIISPSGSTTVSFAVDTGRRMKRELVKVKNLANRIVSVPHSPSQDYILSPFSESASPSSFKYDNASQQFSTAVNVLHAEGGGDCPQVSFHGLLSVLNLGPKYGSSLFLFTDGSPKDANGRTMQVLKAASDFSGVDINIFANPQGCLSADTLARVGKLGIAPFCNVAAHTAGQVIPFKHPMEIQQFESFVKSTLESDVLLALGQRGRGRRFMPGRFSSHKINVDENLSKLTVVVSVQRRNTIQNVLFMDPSNRRVSQKSMISLAKIYIISNPAVGIWTLKVPRNVGKYSFKAYAASSEVIAFDFQFIHYGPGGGKVREMSYPIKGFGEGHAGFPTEFSTNSSKLLRALQVPRVFPIFPSRAEEQIK